MIRFAKKENSYVLAKLHITTLSVSFLASLGFNFLNRLYSFLITKEKVWVYEENKEIKGFVSFSTNSAGMMKRFLISCPNCILLLIGNTIINPSNIKRFIETFKAPFISMNDTNTRSLPTAELLSISVSPYCQSSGIGCQLLTSLEEYLRQNNISQYKVVAGEELIGANKFYIKNGFVLATQINIHGEKKSNVYIKNITQ